jgi:hypothetical protein
MYSSQTSQPDELIPPAEPQEKPRPLWQWALALLAVILACTLISNFLFSRRPVPTETSVTPAPALAGATATPSSAQTGEYQVQVDISDTTPKRNTEVTLTGKLLKAGVPVEGATMFSSWYIWRGTQECSAKTDSQGIARCTRNIGSAQAEVYVQVVINFVTGDGKMVPAQTGFTPEQ